MAENMNERHNRGIIGISSVDTLINIFLILLLAISSSIKFTDHGTLHDTKEGRISSLLTMINLRSVTYSQAFTIPMTKTILIREIKHFLKILNVLR